MVDTAKLAEQHFLVVRDGVVYVYCRPVQAGRSGFSPAGSVSASRLVVAPGGQICLYLVLRALVYAAFYVSIVFSSDGLIYLTFDHYDTFTLLYDGWYEADAKYVPAN